MSIMKIQKIADNVDALLIASDLFVDVLPAPQEGETVKFSGYPSASHHYTTTENNFATVSQNRRIIEYTVEVVNVVPESVSSVEEFAVMNKLADDVIQLFDETQDLSKQSLFLTKACDILRPAPGKLERVPTDSGDGLLLTITLYCEADVAFRN